MRSHINWGGGQNTLYKDMETSPQQMHSKNLEGSLEIESSKRTISASGGLRPLHTHLKQLQTGVSHLTIQFYLVCTLTTLTNATNISTTTNSLLASSSFKRVSFLTLQFYLVCTLITLTQATNISTIQQVHSRTPTASNRLASSQLSSLLNCLILVIPNHQPGPFSSSITHSHKRAADTMKISR